MDEVTVKWAKKNINKINIIDIRTQEDFKQKFIMGSMNIPMDKLIMNHERFLKKSEKYHIICNSGKGSKKLIKELSKKGYNLVNIKDGILGLG